jgi:putative MATE family efflux protein
MGFTMGGQIMVAQEVGSGKKEELRITIGTVSSTVFIFAALITIFGLSLHDMILAIMSTPQEALSNARNYLTIVFAGTFFIFGYTLVSAILRGMGDSKHPLMFVAIAAVINLILDYVFMGLLGWDVSGAAIATIISQAISFVISVVFLYRNREGFGFDFKPKSFKINGGCLKKLTRLGIPFGLQSCAISISMLFVNKFINQYGLAASATFGTGTRIEGIPWILVNGVMMACGSMVGQNLGARKVDRAKKTVHVSLLVCAASTLVFMVLYYFLPTEIFSLFTSDPDVLELAPMFMLVLVVSMPATSIMSPYLAFIEGLGNAELTLLIAILDGFVSRILLSLLLANVLKLGLLGWFLGYGLAAYVSLFLAAGYFYSGIWKGRKLLV